MRQADLFPEPQGLDRRHESAWSGPVCGVDEAGRGPLAGPVVAAAVILPASGVPVGLNDSKKLSTRRREVLAREIFVSCQVGIGQADVTEIDQLNILHAAMLAMQRAVNALPIRPAGALIDGNRLPLDLPCPAHALVRGDAISLAISAASIIAKTERDRQMRALHDAYPHYGWDQNAGYPTRDHLNALEKHGICLHHRRSFRPVALRLSGNYLATD